MRVYLSGPISLGGTCGPDEIAGFSAVFHHEAARLRAAGHDVIDPTEVPEQSCWEDYMRLGIAAVTVSDVVAVLPRWLESRGAVLEVYVARQLGIPVVPADGVAS